MDTRMKIARISLALSLLLLLGCTANEPTYNARFNKDYIYSVGFYGYQPQWATHYYSGVPTRSCAQGYCNYPRGWYMRKW